VKSRGNAGVRKNTQTNSSSTPRHVLPRNSTGDTPLFIATVAAVFYNHCIYDVSANFLQFL